MNDKKREDAALESCVLFTLEGDDDAVVASAIPGRLKTKTSYPEAGRLLCLAGGALPDGAPISGELRGVTVTATPAAADALDGEGLVPIPGWGPGVRFDPQAVDAIVAAITGERTEAVTLRRLHRLYRAVPTFDREPCAGVPAGFAGYVAALDKDPAPAAGNAFTGIFSAAALASAELPPICWTVRGMLPTGLAILASPPKLGKSWLTLDLCLAVASGTAWLGHETTAGAVLYADLEDGPQRLQARMAAIGGGFAPPPDARLECCFDLPDLQHGLLDRLDVWRKEHNDARLIAIDVFQKVRGLPAKRLDAYRDDYLAVGALQKWAIKNRITLLMVHHCNKGVPTGDQLSTISGSFGLTGAADVVLSLSKSRRFDENATLAITGRDLSEVGEFTVRFDKSLCRWEMLGRADELERAAELEAFDADPLTLAAVALTDPGGAWSGTLEDFVNAAAEHRISIPERGEQLGRKLARFTPLFRSRLGVNHSARLTHGKRVHTLSKSQTQT